MNTATQTYDDLLSRTIMFDERDYWDVDPADVPTLQAALRMINGRDVLEEAIWSLVATAEQMRECDNREGFERVMAIARAGLETLTARTPERFGQELEDLCARFDGMTGRTRKRAPVATTSVRAGGSSLFALRLETLS